MVRHLLLVVLLALAGCAPATLTAPSEPAPSPTAAIDSYAAERAAMVHEQLVGRGLRNSGVLSALGKVERHRFVPEGYVQAAYADHPLPIGYGQTISQPYIVGLMSEALKVKPGDRVLEIGTGSGYQAAVLAELGVEVYTVEIIPELARRAAKVLERSRLRRHPCAERRWVFRLGSARPLRCRHRHRRAGSPAAGAGAAAQGGWPAGHPDRADGQRADALAVREAERRAFGHQPGRSELRPAHRWDEVDPG